MKTLEVEQRKGEGSELYWFIKGTDVRLNIRTKDTDVVNGSRVVTLDREGLIEVGAKAYGEFLTVLGYDWRKNPHMSDTPRRVTKSWIDDLAKGDFLPEPRITDFDNDGKYKGMVVVRNIKVTSMCAHHNLPFIGRAHIGYLPGDKVVGLSKFNRVVDHISRKPTVQENITQEIHDKLDGLATGNSGVAVVIEAEHMCVACRGIKDDSSDTATQVLSQEFYDDPKTREEFYMLIGLKR